MLVHYLDSRDTRIVLERPTYTKAEGKLYCLASSSMDLWCKFALKDISKNMQEVIVTIRNRAGVHTRPAAMIVKLAAQFKSNIFLTGENNMRINAKSIIGVMTLAAAQGTTLSLSVEGGDEADAVIKLRDLFESGFGEQL